MAEFTVTNVVDGDTFDVNGWRWNGDEGTRVRPTGYDAPELPTYQGVHAKERLTRLILGRTVEITAAHTIDRGRLVADVFYNGKALSGYFPEYKT